MRAEQHQEAEELEDQELAEAALAAAAQLRSEEGLAAVRADAAEAVVALKAGLEAGAFSPPSATHKNTLYKALKKPKGSMALIGEGSPQSAITLGGYDLNDPKYLSQQFRTAGATAICVRIGGEHELTPTAVKETAAEQDTAKGEFPGPLPIIARTNFIDGVQLAKVAADGAQSAMISLHLNGPEATKALMEAAESYGLEPVLRVANAEEVASALELGAKVLCFGDCSLPQAGELLADVPKDVRTICDVRVRDVRGAWKARDLGFNGLIVSDAVLEVCARDRVPPVAVVKAMLAKGSVKYGLGMQKGRLEGAKESLGTLAM